MNHGLPDIQARFRKGRGTRDQIANIHWIIEKAREFQKRISFCFIDYAKFFDCVGHQNFPASLENSSRVGNRRPPAPVSWEMCMQVKKQQLELDMEQQAGSKLGKAVYCHPAYLTYMKSTFHISSEMPDWMKHKLESRLLGEIQ